MPQNEQRGCNFIKTDMMYVHKRNKSGHGNDEEEENHFSIQRECYQSDERKCSRAS